MGMAISFPTIASSATEPRRWSLRSRLLALLLTMTVGLWTASAILIYDQTIDEGAQLFDESLSEAGLLLLRLAEHEIGEHGPSLGVELMHAEVHRKPFDIQFQIWTAETQAAYRTELAPARPFAPFDAEGFGWTEVEGVSWRTYSTWNAQHTLQMQIAEPLTRRKELSWSALMHLLTIAAVLLPLSMFLIWWILTRSLMPLRRSAASVSQRSPDDLQPVRADDAPSEVAPLLAALNRLLHRVQDTLHRERRFTADASHELRSPLAAIRTNAQVMSAARNKTELARAGEDLLVSVDRSSRLIDQLLVLARIDVHSAEQHEFVEVDLPALIQQACRAQQALMSARQVSIETELRPAAVRGVPNLLGVLLRNLLDNAVRYSGPQAHVTVECRSAGQSVRLVVSDDGPGIPREEREQVFQRFYRIIGNEATGSGLGLSIVQRIAELHGATVEIQTGRGGRGTAFVLVFESAR